MEGDSKCYGEPFDTNFQEKKKMAKSLCNNLTVKATPELVDRVCAPPFIDENMLAQKGEVAYPRSWPITGKLRFNSRSADSLGSLKLYTGGIFGRLDGTGEGTILA